MKKQNLIKIGVILHPLTLNDFYKKFLAFYFPFSYVLMPFLSLIRPYTLKHIYSNFPPHKVFETNKFTIKNAQYQIIAVMCPLFPEQLVLRRDLSQQKIQSSLQLLSKLGVKIVTLAGFSSIVTNGGSDIASKVDYAVTSGNTLTAALTIEGVEKSVAMRKLKLSELRLSIIGATGDIGSVCAKYFAEKVGVLVLCSRNIESNKTFCNDMRLFAQKQILFTSDVEQGIANVDILIVATSAFGYLIDPLKLKKNAIVCDVSMPPNVSRVALSERPDLCVLEGGRAQISFFNKIKSRAWRELFPRNAVYGCLAEGMALALDNQFVNYSFDKGRITIDKINSILAISKRNGIELSEQSWIKV